MEPLDPAKNEESTGFSKRRISSILKAPRKSIIFPEPVQQENVVECAKPVEKRNSRRVSFAPANDVLLFSKEVKNASPARSPLQELITSTAAATQNRVQVVVADDGIQQITGMETLLNAPLHVSQQRETVNFDTGTDFSEKTVMFSTDDAFMDITRSHTINLGVDADVSLQNDDILPTSGEKTVMFTADDGSMDMALSHTFNMSGLKSLPTRSVEKGNISSSVPCLDPGFENFLASFSRPSGPSVNSVITRMVPPAGTSSGFLSQICTKRPDVDKENRAPISLSAVTEKSLNTSRKIGQSSYGSAFYPDDDVSMDMTEPQSQLYGFTDYDDDDPFQCLFPTKEMYSGIESVSQTAEKTQQQSRKTLESFNTKDLDKKSLKNPSLNASNQGHKVKLDTKDERSAETITDTEAQTGHIRGLIGSDDPFRFLFPTQDMCPLSESLKSAEMTSRPQHNEGMETSLRPSLKTAVRRHQVKFDAEDDSKEKTVRFSPDGACMDMTQSHTVNNLELQSHPNVDFLPPFGDKTVRFTAHDAAMDVTQSHTVNIIGDLELQAQQKEDFLPTCGEKTVRFTANDAAMDVTRSHTVNIGANLEPQFHQNVDFLPPCGEKTVRFTANDAAMDVTQSHTVHINSDLELQSQQKGEFLPTCGEKTVRFTANDAAMDVTRSHTVNIGANLEPQFHQNVDFLPQCGEKTVRFTANDAAMDVTQSHTVHINSDLELQSQQKGEFLPTCGEKTVRFTANDAAMDVTRSHTVNIGANLEPQFRQNVNFLPPCGEKTVRFTANDAAMDVTQSHTVHINSDLELQSQQKEESIPTCGEKTVRFTANDAAIDVTRSHTVNIGANLEAQFHQNVDFLPPCGEKTVRFTANDAAMDISQCLTVNIANSSVSDSVLQHQDSNILSILSVKERESETCRRRRNQSSSAYTLDPGLKNSLSKMSGPWANPVITKAVVPAASSFQETGHTNGFLDKLKPQKPDVETENEVPGLISAVMEKTLNKTVTGCPADNLSVDMSEAQTGQNMGQTCTDEPPQSLSSIQDLYPSSDHLRKAEAITQQSNGALGSSNLDGVEMINCPNSLDSKETKPRNHACSPTAVGHGVDTVPSLKCRRMSLADLHSKVRRLSHMINTTPDTIALNSCTAPLPPLEHHMDKISKDKPNSLPVMEPEPEIGLVNTEENTQCLTQEEQPSTTPFNLKTKQLMSRLSVGGFKPKLPQRSKPDDPTKVNSVAEHTRTITVNVTSQLSNLENDVSDIYDEELGSCEDMSEVLDARSPQKATEKGGPQEFKMVEFKEDDVFEQDFISAVHGNKRPRPADENGLANEKRMKTSTEMADDFKMSHVEECDGNITTAPSMTTQTSDSSSHTASIRCEATFESTFRQSMFESQLEDYASDVQRKFEDGTITVLEFFKLFNIDFVIHNPRQSILPGRLLSDTDCTPMDLLKDRHINRPKQMVYETNVLNLTEKVEGLKERMRDLEKPLKIVNRPLWEEMRHFSEKELKSFGAKLKERNNVFRKMSKVQSHEKKEVLYADLVQANLEEQQRLRGTIEEADEMIKSLDDCICELETELSAVEEKGFEDAPSLKSLQKEMQKVTEVLADNDRQISELEMQNKQNSNKLCRLKVETMNLESHVAMLHSLNEWKLGEKKDNCSVYSFLHKTFEVQLVYEKSNGNDADNESERKISHITFRRQIDDEKSQCHARLVHKLLSQCIERETSWVEKYPTSRHVPKLLLDVGLVVSHCRLLGEELRLLKMWGGLRLDILNISCVDNRVHVVFCSLKKFSKFEVIFSVSVTNHLYVLQVQSFKNRIGSTTIQQIEEIVASFNPAKNLLTKIIKKIHENLLC
ncbi:kinetochore scaffold 1 [Micropterus dolomieu]|uniref:kinetochore scaffold 1 n=1 Tax=Micropterus dolomieu TaxID=147949 RepID=UPI001E8D3ABD|nr:kinetochore scaffold 1 [Micropterus dolomieu]